MSNSLTNTQITDMLRGRGIYFNGVFSKDLLPSKLQQGWYIINMEDHDKGNGTHWVALNYGREFTEYFDSFGFPPPKEVLRAVGDTNLIRNRKQIQDFNSSACGWYCIACVASDVGVPSPVHFRRFLNRFVGETRVNDVILKSLLDHLGFKTD